MHFNSLLNINGFKKNNKNCIRWNCGEKTEMGSFLIQSYVQPKIKVNVIILISE